MEVEQASTSFQLKQEVKQEQDASVVARRSRVFKVWYFGCSNQFNFCISKIFPLSMKKDRSRTWWNCLSSTWSFRSWNSKTSLTSPCLMRISTQTARSTMNGSRTITLWAGTRWFSTASIVSRTLCLWLRWCATCPMCLARRLKSSARKRTASAKCRRWTLTSITSSRTTSSASLTGNYDVRHVLTVTSSSGLSSAASNAVPPTTTWPAWSGTTIASIRRSETSFLASSAAITLWTSRSWRSTRWLIRCRKWTTATMMTASSRRRKQSRKLEDPDWASCRYIRSFRRTRAPTESTKPSRAISATTCEWEILWLFAPNFISHFSSTQVADETRLGISQIGPRQRQTLPVPLLPGSLPIETSTRWTCRQSIAQGWKTISGHRQPQRNRSRSGETLKWILLPYNFLKKNFFASSWKIKKKKFNKVNLN